MQFQFQLPYINLNDQSHALRAWAKGDASCSHTITLCAATFAAALCVPAGRISRLKRLKSGPLTSPTINEEALEHL